MKTYHDRPYLALLQDVMKNGRKCVDRTGTGTIKVFSRQMRFDLSDGTIPLLTTKKMHLPAIFHELLWYVEGNTSAAELENKKVRIWREWADKRGELGPLYGGLWRSWETNNELVFITPKQAEDVKIKPSVQLSKIEPEISSDKFISSIFTTKECGDVKIIRRDETDKHGDHKYTIQFLETGYVKSNVRKSVIRRGHIIDVYKPRVFGVGYLGDYDKTDLNVKGLQRHWYKMIERCYDTSSVEYLNYGGKGVTVHSDWLCFATFQKEVKHIPNWNNKRTNWTLYELDKDYFQSDQYGKDTCVWLLTSHNTLYRKNPKPFKVTTPDGNTFLSLSVSNIAEKYNLKIPSVYKVLSGKRHHHHYFKFEYIEIPKGKLARYKLPVDQLQSVIERLKINPDDRRLVISAWNPALLPEDGKTFCENVKNGKQALPPCHYVFQFFSTEMTQEERIRWFTFTFGENNFQNETEEQVKNTLDNHNVPTRSLSCMLNQRSCDTFLGVPFNVAQYSVLTRMICEVVGMAPGELIWNGGDTHIYLNHFDQVKEQLKRDPYPSPTLHFARAVDNIDDFGYDDFVVEDYQFHPTISAKVSV